MAKRGRPRKAGMRYPNGKLKSEQPPLHWQRMLEAVRTVAFDPRLESPIGRMALAKKITPHAMDAAMRFLEARMSADAALGLPARSARAQDMNAVHGLLNAFEDEDHARKCRRAVEAYDRAERAVGYGSVELATLQYVVIYGNSLMGDYERELVLYEALARLMRHYGINGTARPQFSVVG